MIEVETLEDLFDHVYAAVEMQKIVKVIDRTM